MSAFRFWYLLTKNLAPFYILIVLLMLTDYLPPAYEWWLLNHTPAGRAIVEKTPRNREEALLIQERVQAELSQSLRATVVVGEIGSGVIVSPKGLILTAGHVLQRLQDDSATRRGIKIDVRLWNGKIVTGVIEDIHPHHDIGVARIVSPGEWPFAPLAPENSVQRGDWSFALGHPRGYEPGRGAVLRVGRIIIGRESLLRTDCQLSSGDSGGPLFDLSGRIVGIHTFISEDITSNYHIPADLCRRIWPSLQEPRLTGSAGLLSLPEPIGFRGANQSRWPVEHREFSLARRSVRFDGAERISDF